MSSYDFFHPVGMAGLFTLKSLVFHSSGVTEVFTMGSVAWPAGGGQVFREKTQ